MDPEPRSRPDIEREVYEILNHGLQGEEVHNGPNLTIEGRNEEVNSMADKVALANREKLFQDLADLSAEASQATLLYVSLMVHRMNNEPRSAIEFVLNGLRKGLYRQFGVVIVRE